MNKKFTLLLSLVFVFCFLTNISVSAAPFTDYSVNSSNSYIEYLDDGSYFVITLESNDGTATLSTNKVGTKTTTYYSSSNVALCALTISATFSYDGSTVSCVGTQYKTYSYDDEWSVENIVTSRNNSSTTKASATASGNFVMRSLGIKVKSIPTSTTIYCDKNGTLS